MQQAWVFFLLKTLQENFVHRRWKIVYISKSTMVLTNEVSPLRIMYDFSLSFYWTLNTMVKRLFEFLLFDAINIQSSIKWRKRNKFQGIVVKKKFRSSTPWCMRPIMRRKNRQRFQRCLNEFLQFSRIKVLKNNGKVDVSRAGACKYFLRSLYFLAGATGRKGPRKRQIKGEKGTKKERDW